MAKGLGKPHTNFGILLPMDAWVMTVSNLGYWSSDLDVGAFIF